MNTGLILMFVALAVCLLIGVPVAFSIGISCMTLLYVNGGPSMDILLQRMVSGAKSFNAGDAHVHLCRCLDGLRQYTAIDKAGEYAAS